MRKGEARGLPGAHTPGTSLHEINAILKKSWNCTSKSIRRRLKTCLGSSGSSRLRSPFESAAGRWFSTDRRIPV
jgi:hypothetical protein